MGTAPIYVAFFALQLGLAIGANSLWLVVMSIASIAIIGGVVVRREERYLAATFGAEYRRYTGSVRRWL